MVLANFKIFSRVFFSLALLFGIVLVGSLGFMYIEGWDFLSSFYMTIITISTVGFNEVNELSDGGRIFTSILILTSIGTFTYTISAITTYFVAGEYKDKFKAAKLEKEINGMSGHVIVCGFGRVGDMAVKELIDHNIKVVIVEASEDKIDLLNETPSLIYIKGNATVDDNLIKAGIHRASSIITTLPDDADNLYVVLTARELNPDLTIISRASKTPSVKKLRIAGANNVIMPDKVGGAHMASLVTTPDVMDFLDHIRIQGGTDINLEEVTFADLPGDFQYQTLGDLDVRNRIGVNIIGFKVSNGEYVINPGPETRIVPNSKLFVLGNQDQIKLLNRIFGL